MLILSDTNLLLRSVQRSHPACRVARRALSALYRDGHTLCLTLQNMAEFWNVCTRPIHVNGMGLGIAATDRFVGRLERLFSILPDSIEVFQIWRQLVVEHSVIGVQVHDARLVATMKAHNIRQIITFNVQDFARYRDIEVVHPDAIK